MIIHTNKPLAPRAAHDVYTSPSGTVWAALSPMSGMCVTRMADPGCGENGVWGQVARLIWNPLIVTGVDIREVERHPAYDQWITGDYLTVDLPGDYDLICGNFPYKLNAQFIRKSLTLLSPTGTLVMLGRLSFLEGVARGNGLWREHPPSHISVLKRRPRFNQMKGTDGCAYAIYYWEADVSLGPTTLGWM